MLDNPKSICYNDSTIGKAAALTAGKQDRTAAHTTTHAGRNVLI